MGVYSEARESGNTFAFAILALQDTRLVIRKVFYEFGAVWERMALLGIGYPDIDMDQCTIRSDNKL